MPLPLASVYLRLCRRLDLIEKAFQRYVAIQKDLQRLERFAIQEGFTSQIWQTWCGFCRSFIINSSLGTITRSGNALTSPYAHHPEDVIAHIFKQFSQKIPPNQLKLSPIAPHLEPTWGDISKIDLGLNRMAITNHTDISSTISTFTCINDIQLCRNSSAHLSSHYLTKISNIKANFDSPKFTHPSDMIFWIYPDTGKTAIIHWLDELRFAADLITA